MAFTATLILGFTEAVPRPSKSQMLSRTIFPRRINRECSAVMPIFEVMKKNLKSVSWILAEFGHNRSCNHLIRIISTCVHNTKKSQVL